MRVKRAFMPLALAAIVMAMSAPGHAAPTVVGTDDAGDWGIGDPDADPVLAEVGAALGQDLIEASIEEVETTVNFTIKVTSLPAPGGVPEVTRYVWDAMVNGKLRELDGKFTNYSRGVCDPTSGKCPPPRDPGPQPFFVRGNCVATGSVTTCEELGIVQATFDAGAGTITIPVPHALLGEGCLDIDPGANLFGETISAIPAAFLSSAAFPLDTLQVEESFTTCT